MYVKTASRRCRTSCTGGRLRRGTSARRTASPIRTSTCRALTNRARRTSRCVSLVFVRRFIAEIDECAFLGFRVNTYCDRFIFFQKPLLFFLRFPLEPRNRASLRAVVEGQIVLLLRDSYRFFFQSRVQNVL